MCAAPVRTESVAGPIHPLLAAGAEHPFTRLERRRRELQPPGVATINLGMGDPREETPAFIREALRAAVPAVSSYPATAGKPELRAACAAWLERRHGVRVDPDTQVLPANGTKEAVFLLPFAVLAPGAPRDTVVIPTPGYPIYESGTRFAGGRPHVVPLRSADGWRFDPDRVDEAVWRRTALLWLNSPHNPTGAVLDADAAARTVALARRHGFWIASDEAYADLWFEGEAPATLLRHGPDNIVALFTLSKRSAMTGYRSGFMAGDPRLMEALLRFRPNAGTATPDFVQDAAIAAWNEDAHPGEQRARYAAKRALFLAEFARRGWKVEASQATFYLWMRVPDGDDVGFVERLLRLGVVTTPGSFLGEGGAGFVRWALVPTLAQCREALRRMEALAP
ncbi:MAG TPA: aminotransferase class I/II-fold pyridoxal phosphate-dependent enzyme [Candidatus Eisenbacteria bacterium]|nr:aminotransferase class I/II-fold pyridoxal phosphate-dependent enzyme [Candidatus Eisenbacteria bacterium]